MLPTINNINELEENQPSFTYNINIETNRISGYIDNREAITQAIYLILQTERYESVIYNWYYGVELDSLIGKNRDFVNNEIQRMIKEGLLEDDRIIEVKDFDISYSKDTATVFFTVVSIIGDIAINWEVSI